MSGRGLLAPVSRVAIQSKGRPRAAAPLIPGPGHPAGPHVAAYLLLFHFLGGKSGDVVRSASGRPVHPPAFFWRVWWWTVGVQDAALVDAARRAPNNWREIARLFKDRTDVQCMERYQKIAAPAVIKGPWSKEVRVCMGG